MALEALNSLVHEDRLDLFYKIFLPLITLIKKLHSRDNIHVI